MARKVIYYDDELTDDFAGTSINGRKIDENYEYIHKNPVWRAFSNLFYYIFAIPIVWIIEHIIFGIRFVGREKLAKTDSPVFLYGNHTGWYDAFTPCLLSFPRRNYTMTSPDAVSIFGLRWVVEMLGAIPVPSTQGGARGFVRAVEHHHRSANITIYPEAHIWPYYTGVRHFSDASFTYPARYGCPVYAFFTAYSKPRGLAAIFGHPSITVYVSDPIYADEGLGVREARQNLCEKVYEFMLQASKMSDYEVYEYKKKET